MQNSIKLGGFKKMNYFEELRKRLEGFEKAEEIIEFSKKNIPLEFIPKTKYNEKIEELEAINTKLGETNKQIEELKNSTSNVDEYKQKLEKLTQEYDEYKGEADKRVANLQKSSLLKDKLIKEGADKDNLDLLIRDFNLDEMQLKDDKIIGLDDLISPIKEKRARLFVQESTTTGKPDDGKEADKGIELENRMRAAAGLDPK